MISVLNANWRILRFLFAREYAVRYRRTVLGVVWAVIPTVIGAVAGMLAINSFNGNSSSTPNFFDLFLRLTILQVTTEAISNSFQLSIRFRNLFHYSNLNPFLVPVSSLFFVGINLGIRIIALIALAFYFPTQLSGFIWTLPFVLLASFILGMSLSIFLIPASFVFWDLRYSTGYITGAFFLLSPIIYDVNQAPAMLRTLMNINPVTNFILFGQELVFAGNFVPSLLVYPFCVSITLLLGGYFYYRRSVNLAAEYL